jgi:hypothetical protein
MVRAHDPAAKESDTQHNHKHTNLTYTYNYPHTPRSHTSTHSLESQIPYPHNPSSTHDRLNLPILILPSKTNTQTHRTRPSHHHKSQNQKYTPEYSTLQTSQGTQGPARRSTANARRRLLTQPPCSLSLSSPIDQKHKSPPASNQSPARISQHSVITTPPRASPAL